MGAMDTLGRFNYSGGLQGPISLTQFNCDESMDEPL